MRRPAKALWTLLAVMLASAILYGLLRIPGLALPAGLTIETLHEVSLPDQPQEGEAAGQERKLPFVRQSRNAPNAPPWQFEAKFNTQAADISALLIGRVAGSVELYLDDVQISAVSYGASPMLEIGYRPMFVALPATRIDSRHRLRVVVWPDGSGMAGLDRIEVGPYAVVERSFYRLWFLHIGSYIVALTAAALAMCLSLIIWRGTGEAAYRDFAVASLAIFFCFAGHLIFGSGSVSQWNAFALSACWLIFAAFVISSAARIAMPRLALTPSRTIVFLTTSLLAAALACWFELRNLLIVVLFSGHVYGVAVAMQIWSDSNRRLNVELCVFLGAMVLAGGLGAVDVMMRLGADQGFGGPPLNLGATMIVLLTIFIFAIYQYLQASHAIRDWNRQLTLQINRAEFELQQVYDRLLVREKHAAILAERHRILKEMHDGVGGQLVATMSLAQHDDTPRSEIVNALDACVTELRLAIDSLDPAHSDLLNALSALRARLSPVLDRSGIALDWSVRELENRKAMSPDQVLQIFRILQEGVSNVIKHSGASRAALICGYSDRHGIVWLTLRDNGYGCESTERRTEGYGLRNMRSRAQAIGAELSIRLGSRERPGTRVRLVWRTRESASAAIEPKSSPRSGL